jgi:hypothetical protein
MRGDDVPEEHSLLQAQLVDDAVDDRRGRLCRPSPAQLSLGRERNPGYARAAVARRFADEQDLGVVARFEVRLETGAKEPGTRAACVLVEGVTDPGGGEAFDEGRGS